MGCHTDARKENAPQGPETVEITYTSAIGCFSAGAGVEKVERATGRTFVAALRNDCEEVAKFSSGNVLVHSFEVLTKGGDVIWYGPKGEFGGALGVYDVVPGEISKVSVDWDGLTDAGEVPAGATYTLRAKLYGGFSEIEADETVERTVEFVYLNSSN